MQGRGRYEWVDGKTYEGEWDKDEMHGSGVYILPEGRKYVGEFVRGKKQGYGRMEELEGEYVGRWAAGLKEGKGKFIYKDGREMQGIWRNNVVVETISVSDPLTDREEPALARYPQVERLPIREEPQKVEKSPIIEPPQPKKEPPIRPAPKQKEISPAPEEIKQKPSATPQSPALTIQNSQSSSPISPPTVTAPLSKQTTIKSPTSDPNPTKPTSPLISKTSPAPALSGIPARGAIEPLSEAKRQKSLQTMLFPSEFTLTDFSSEVAIQMWETLGAFVYTESTSSESLFSLALLVNSKTLYKGETTSTRVRLGRGMTLSEGCILEGTWEDDQLQGIGRAIESDGSVYMGYWDRGRKQGFGVLRDVRRVVYAGEWVNGEQEGLGYERGGLITYKGHFHKGYKQGHGRLEIAKEGVYEGNFEKDIREGYGTMVFLDGKKYAGEWHEDRMEGKGVKLAAGLTGAISSRRTEVSVATSSAREEAERLTFNPFSNREEGRNRPFDEDEGRFTIRPKSSAINEKRREGDRETEAQGGTGKRHK